MRIARCFLVLLVGMIMCTVILPCPSLSETNTQDPYYTKVNIWYEEPGKILATNYHKGAIIPAGTQVNNVKVSSNSIAFQVEGMHGVIFNIINVPAHTLMKTQELFDLYFSKEDIKKKLGLLSKFSIAEKKHIENGEIAVGMHKDAVVMSYGYPPKHKTPDLSVDIWYYWASRFVVIQVIFKNNRIETINHNFKMTR